MSKTMLALHQSIHIERMYSYELNNKKLEHINELLRHRQEYAKRHSQYSAQGEYEKAVECYELCKDVNKVICELLSII